MDLSSCESEEHEHGVGAGVNAIIMSDVPYGIGLAESASSALSCLVIMENSPPDPRSRMHTGPWGFFVTKPLCLENIWHYIPHILFTFRQFRVYTKNLF